MEMFKKELKRQQFLLFIGVFVAVSAYFLCKQYQTALFAVDDQDFILGFQSGILVALVCMLVFYLIRNQKALGNAESLKKLYIYESDERTLLIRQKSGSTGMSITIYGLIVATIIAGVFNYVVFYSLLSATLFVALVFGFFKFYYRKKY